MNVIKNNIKISLLISLSLGVYMGLIIPQKDRIVTKQERVVEKVPALVKVAKELNKTQYIQKNNNIRVANISNESLKTLFLARNLDLDLINFLIGNGLDINKADEDGLTALANLFLLSDTFDKNKIEKLIDLGADLNRKTKQELDILNMALLNKNMKTRRSLVNYLKEKGISFAESDNPTKYLMSINRYLGNRSYLNEIVPNIKNVNMKLPNGNDAFLHIVSIGASNKNIKYFLDNGVDLTSDEPHKIMHAAIMHGALMPSNMLKMINLGADVNSRTEGVLATPLMAAAMVGDTRRAKILLKSGADINLVDSNNGDVFTYANKISNKELREKTIQFFKEYKNET